MRIDRRKFLGTGIAAAGLMSISSGAAAQDVTLGAGGTRKTFVLVHGSWHDTGVWESLTPMLIAAGHTVIARDLPGRGINALFPASYFQRPFDAGAFAQEPSPVAGVTLEDNIASIIETIGVANAGGAQRIILVGHSSAGFSITAVAERYPQLISHIVYVAAMMNANGVSPNDDLSSADNGFNQNISAALIGAPPQIGALRFDWNSLDPVYAPALQNLFYNDVAPVPYRAVANLLTPDDPAGPFSVPVTRTAQRWGSIPRSYVRTALDRVILPTLQDRWIAQANALTPSNSTKVYPIESSHSPFISQPQKLGEALLDVANRTP
ncbi:alpha/beta fold hydrolase [Granulicella mallensis]|uniref:Alpha/beta hydrolase fold protein n=2 Tax=Granulicella mallensis TaxID=940614 RepID=G8NZI2_GRAMM|nr:alpha/beta fold hydrolase [Granulicella mallensis]AEU38010.1 alpha/beta hydrolase fold protein [Granulicella mallensis MP5ACTX8]MBB5062066.1 pimeloyl-ACP methyl ester carboxylesterase [Granulicella mallensis]